MDGVGENKGPKAKRISMGWSKSKPNQFGVRRKMIFSVFRMIVKLNKQSKNTNGETHKLRSQLFDYDLIIWWTCGTQCVPQTPMYSAADLCVCVCLEWWKPQTFQSIWEPREGERGKKKAKRGRDANWAGNYQFVGRKQSYKTTLQWKEEKEEGHTHTSTRAMEKHCRSVERQKELWKRRKLDRHFRAFALKGKTISTFWKKKLKEFDNEKARFDTKNRV